MGGLIVIFKGLWPYKWPSLAAIFFNIISTVLFLFIPLGGAFLINKVLPDENMNMIMAVGIILIIVGVLSFFFSYLANYFTQKVSSSYSRDLRNNLYRKILGLSKQNINKYSSGKLQTISTNDVSQVEMFTSFLFTFIIFAPIMLLGSLFLSIQLSPELSMIYIIIIPILAIAILIIAGITLPKFKKLQKTTDKMNTVSKESVNNVRLIKSFVTMEEEYERFDEVATEYKDVSYKANRNMALALPVVVFVMNLGLGLLLLLSGMLIQNGYLLVDSTIQTGTIIAFSSYVIQSCIAVMMLTFILVFVSRATVSANRINELMCEEVDVKNNEKIIKHEISGDIKFENVSFKFSNGSENVLNNINLNIKSGEEIGIIGSTGSGKTTLINLLTREYDVTDGKVLFDDVNIKDIDLKYLRNQIGVATQTPFVFSGTIESNIKMGKNEATKKELENATKNASAYNFINEKTSKFNEVTLKSGTNLSGGQKQRLSLSRTLVKEPTILILDDTTSALDANTEEEINNNIKEIKDCKTKIIIAQKISTVKPLDKIIVLDNYGNLDGFGNHNNLLENSKVYKEIYESQYGGDSNE